MSTAFTLKSQHFEGPLEALVSLIEARKLSISEVNLAQVCDSYLAYVENLPELPLKETAQFILVASTLLLIKSRSLLPTFELSADERESVEELERRLARLAVYRKASRLLRKRWGEEPRTLARAAPARPVQFAPGEITRENALQAMQRILHSLPISAVMKEAVVAPVRALEEILTEVRRTLTRAIRASFSEMTARSNREERIVYFLAMLELVRSGSVSVSQGALFADILIELEGQSSVPRYGI